MGSTVGPALSRALGSKWKVEGVKYTADIAGDDCIGFPGGIKCRDQLETLSAACPETKWFLSGYSQGAMVARICAAYSKAEIKEKIKVRRCEEFGEDEGLIYGVSRVLLSLVILSMVRVSKVSRKMPSRPSVLRLMACVKGNFRLRRDI
jgi:hypothetical protein